MSFGREAKNLLTTRALQQHNFQYQMQQLAMSQPYIKPKPTLYAKGTTLASNNPAVVRRNARERNRVKQVNCGFTHLRQRIPPAIIADLSNGRRGIGPGANKKLSKVDTLHMALEYIRLLKCVIDDCDSSDVNSEGSYSNATTNSNSSSISSVSPTPYTEAITAPNPLFYPAFNCEKYSNQMTNYSTNNYYNYKQTQLNAEAEPISPAVSNDSAICSDYKQYSADVIEQQENQFAANLKTEPAAFYEEYASNATDDEELLDYISRWQDGL